MIKVGDKVTSVRDGHQCSGWGSGIVDFVGRLGDIGGIKAGYEYRIGFAVARGGCKHYVYHTIAELEAGDVVIVDNAPPRQAKEGDRVLVLKDPRLRGIVGTVTPWRSGPLFQACFNTGRAICATDYELLTDGDACTEWAFCDAAPASVGFSILWPTEGRYWTGDRDVKLFGWSPSSADAKVYATEAEAKAVVDSTRWNDWRIVPAPPEAIAAQGKTDRHGAVDLKRAGEMCGVALDSDNGGTRQPATPIKLGRAALSIATNLDKPLDANGRLVQVGDRVAWRPTDVGTVTRVTVPDFGEAIADVRCDDGTLRNSFACYWVVLPTSDLTRALFLDDPANARELHFVSEGKADDADRCGRIMFSRAPVDVVKRFEERAAKLLGSNS